MRSSFRAAQDPVVSHQRDLGFQAGPAVINGAAMHAGEAEAAALVKAQRINIVIGGNDPKAGASVLQRQLLDRLDQGSACPVPLPGSVKGQDLALPPGLVRQIGEHSQQVPVRILGDKRRIVLGMDQLPETGHAGTAMPGQERLSVRLVGGLSRTDPHRISL